METLKWVFELFDKFSGPSDNITRSLRRMQDGLDGANRGSDSFLTKLHQIAHTSQIVIDGLERLGRTAIGAVKSFLQPAMFKEDTMMALETVMRSKSEAQDLFHKAVKFAALSPLTTQDTLDFAKQFIMAGFGKNDTMTLLQGVSDVGALKGFSPLRMQEFVTHLGIIKGQGYLSQQQLHLLVRDGIMPIDKAMAGVAKVTGMSMDQVEHAIHTKGISSMEGIKGILAALAEMGGGKLGTLTMKGSQTLSGLLSTLVSKPFELLMNLDMSKGFDRVKGFVRDLTDVLEPEGPEGIRLMEAAQSMFDGITEALFADFEGATLKDKMKSALKEFAEFMKSVNWSGVFHDLREAIAGIGAVLKPVIGLLEKLSSVDTWLREHTKGAKSPFENKDPFASAIGTLFGTIAGNEGDKKSFARFMFGEPPMYEMAGRKAADALQKGYAEKLEIHSPSKVFERFGRYSAQGFELGFNGPQPGQMKGLPTAGAGGRGITVPITINATEGGAALAQKVKDVVLSALTSTFEEVAIEAGVS